MAVAVTLQLLNITVTGFSLGEIKNSVSRSGLLQQYFVDQYSKIEGTKLDYLKANQSRIRSYSYKRVKEAVN